MAGERADLLAQIHSAQADIEQVLSQLASDAGAVVSEGQAQRQLLAQLERSILSGASVPPATLRGEVASALAAAISLGQQARAANEQRAVGDLATAQARTRASVAEASRDVYERHIFDPYLRFDSAQDEAEYRRREEQNRRAIEDALAEQTPEGDLRAARIMRTQLRDAEAHGADASPEFRRLADRNAQDVSRLEVQLGPERSSEAQQPAVAANAEAAPAPASPEQLASVLATFRAAGVGGGLPATHSAHGLTVDASATVQGPAFPA